MAIVNTPYQSSPAVSVIVPMYNEEKYIVDCMESILAQTFKNFEVIVVNNCSTDNSPAIVESYKEKFGGRLTLLKTDYNTNSGAIPRDKGLYFSRGEYLFIIDADDLITATALEELYTLAKEYDADVIYCEKNYRAKDDGTLLDIEIGHGGTLVDKPTFETDDIPERLQKLFQGKYRWPQWRKMVRRSFIFKHEIFFPDTRPSDDDVWTYGLLFYAKKILRVPNIVYVRRLSEGSIMREKKTPQQTVTFWINPILLGLKALDKLMSKHEFFQQNPQYRYAVLERFITAKFGCFLEDSFHVPPFAIYEAIKQEYGNKLGEQDVLIAALCAFINTQQKISIINQQKFDEFTVQSQKELRASKQKFKELAGQVQQVIDELELKNK